MATLVTGAGGRIGAWVCRRLIEKGLRKTLDEFPELRKVRRLVARDLETAK